MNRAGQLPFTGTSFGSWWGNDAKEKRQADIDVIMADRGTKQILLGECKWRKEAPAPATVEEFLAKDYLIPQYQQFYHCFFSKAPFGEEIRRLERSGAIRLFDLYSLFAEGL